MGSLNKSFRSLRQIEDFAFAYQFKCMFCGAPLRKAESYPHPNGVVIEGVEGKQWVYFSCPKCKYEWALGKLIK